MCGLIGYVGGRPAVDLILAGLDRLEYRGYDSAGIAVARPSGITRARSVGSLARLRELVHDGLAEATTGIGHTRWATHGRVATENAHPLAGCRQRELALVLNGIVENFADLRAALRAQGHEFRSETDAEVVAHLIESEYDGDLAEAVLKARRHLEGHFAFIAMHRDHPNVLVGTRRYCPLVVGLGESETFLASMVQAFISETRRVKYVEDDDVVAVDADGAEFRTPAGTFVPRAAVDVDWDDEAADMGDHDSYMLKEIHEQPDALDRTLVGRLHDPEVLLREAGVADRPLDKIVVVACGTAYHAGLVGRYAIEAWARMPCDVDIASEWRYRDPLLNPRTLVVGITQSGETADTLAALRLARAAGAPTVALTNMMGSQATREADATLLTRAGLEMGVAATKTYTAQAGLMIALALALGRRRGTLSAAEHLELIAELEELPRKVAEFLEREHPIREIAERYHESQFFLYLGRHVGLPVCLEGALKLKEISYIPTEAYSAGEMKHGPIALIDEQTPVVVIATDSHVYDKVVSNIEETRARGGRVLAIATEGNERIQHMVEDVIYVPKTHPLLSGILAAIPLQLLAYHVARERGLDADRPRNLAKTVTVE